MAPISNFLNLRPNIQGDQVNYLDGGTYGKLLKKVQEISGRFCATELSHGSIILCLSKANQRLTPININPKTEHQHITIHFYPRRRLRNRQKCQEFTERDWTLRTLTCEKPDNQREESNNLTCVSKEAHQMNTRRKCSVLTS